MLMSDWPIAYISWLLFCTIYWLAIGIAIMGKRYMHERHRLNTLKALLKEETK